MRAEFCFYRTVDNTNLRAKGDVIEFLDHLSTSEVAERSSLRLGRTGRSGPSLVGKLLFLVCICIEDTVACSHTAQLVI